MNWIMKDIKLTWNAGIKAARMLCAFCGNPYFSLFILMSSCTAEGLVEDGSSVVATPIAFTTYTSQPVTRADSSYLAINSIPWGKSIGVYAYYHDNSTWSTAAKPNFMCNQQATNNGLDQSFTYSPLKYWPNEVADKISFIAYYPYTSNSASDISATGVKALLENSSDTGLPTFLFTVNNDVKKQIDFMISDLLPNLPNGTSAVSPSNAGSRDDLTVTDRVRFNFHHALAKIEFRVVVPNDVRKDLAYFTLKKIQLKSVSNEAKLTPSYDGTTTTLAWSSYSASTTNYNCKTTEAYLLLPQTLADAVQLEITYDLAFKSEGTTYTYDGSGNPVATEEYVYTNRTTSVQLNTLKLSGTNTVINEWLPNHHYIYNLVIKPHRIEFTGQVVDNWGQEVPLSATMEE